MEQQILSVIVPVYNEQNTVQKVLDKILSVDLIGGVEIEIVLVDDCSTDQTAQIINKYIQNRKDANIKHYRHEKNKGKGGAIHTGLASAKGDFVIIQDADLEYDPEEFNIMLGPILDGHADVVYGSRFSGGKPHRALFFWHTIGNKFLTFLSNVFTNLNLTDIETCYKLFKKEIINQIDLKEKRFGFEPEVTAKVSRIPGIRIYEVGISYYGRSFEDGKKIGWRDGFRAMYAILKYNVFSK